MKKFFLIWAVLALAVPAMAVVNVTATQVGDTNEVDITVSWSGEATIPRAFALDITVDAGTITKVTNYHTGESETGNKGFGIFPASFNREIDANDPNWADVKYTPVADVNDLVSGTQPGIDSNGITIEMGSLYEAPNAPPSPSMLCTIIVTADDCNVCFALNVGRGGIVMEDGNAPSSYYMPCTKVTVGALCMGDYDENATVNTDDMNTLLLHLFFNGTGDKYDAPVSPGYECFDFDGNNSLNTDDMNTLLLHLFFNGTGDKYDAPCVP